MSGWSWAGTWEITWRIRSGSPATTPAATAARMPLSPPVLGTMTLFTFLMILPDTSARIFSGRAPSTARSRAAA